MKQSTTRRQLFAFVSTILVAVLVSAFFLTANTFAETQQGETYSELRGGRAGSYAVQNINELERPYNYVIGQTTHPLIEVLGVLAALGALGFGLFHGLGRLIASRRNAIRLEEVGREYIYSLFTRVWHWVNAIIILALLYSGFQMHYAGPYHIYGHIHHWFAYALMVEYACFLAYEVLTRDIKQFIPAAWEFTEGTIRQARFYAIGIFKGEEHPYHMVKEHRLNPLQKPAYFSIMFGLVPVLILTGLVLMRPDWTSFLINWIGGQENVRYVFYLHLVSAFGILAFLVGHLYLATTGDTVKQHYEVMVTGFHRVYKYHRNK